MSRAAVLVGLLALAAAGCQTFIGVEDVNAHLPRLDGTYLMTISRTRSGGAEDRIRLRTIATLDHSTRTLDLEYSMLDFDAVDETPVAEGSISDLEFPADSATMTFSLNLQIPEDAVAAPAPTGPDASVVAEMVLHAQAEYSFCAKPADTTQPKPTFGTILLPPGTPITNASTVDISCDP